MGALTELLNREWTKLTKEHECKRVCKLEFLLQQKVG